MIVTRESRCVSVGVQSITMAELGSGVSGGAAGGGSEEFSHDAMAFEALERDFQEVMPSTGRHFVSLCAKR
jgi:hypothetical protein